MSIEELCEKVKLQGESRTHEDRVRLLSKAKLYKQTCDKVLLSRANNKGIPLEFDDNGSCKEFLTELYNKVTTDNKHDDKLPDVKGDELL